MREIKGTTRVCGLVGNPVAHSMSPMIHNNLAQLCDIDMAYVTFKVESDNIESSIKGAYNLDILGMNVTVPHKKNVINALIDIDPLAKSIGAVNTLVRIDGGYKGYNTDILGLKRELEEADIELCNREVIILGAGGAAKAIAFLCASEKTSQVYILNRTVEKAIAIANEINKTFGTDCVKAMSIADYEQLQSDNYIAIQTTSVGLYPNCDEALIEDPKFYEKIAVGVDIIYNPAKTLFMKLTEKSGAKAYNGLKMLLYQGVSAFELWNDIMVSEEAISKVYELMKKELNIVE